MTTAEILTAYETCERKGYWSLSWQPNRMPDTALLQDALRTAMLTDRKDYGEAAGERVLELAEERGVETRSHQVYAAATSTACLADMLAVGIRQSHKEAPWRVPETLDGVWTPGTLISPCGAFLRRFVLASSWSDDRRLGEVNSWRTMGEIAHYEMPMQLVVAVIGPVRDGKRHSYFSKGLLHPKNHKLRFRKKSNSTSTDFKGTWEKVWREDHDEIATHEWLAAMAEDDVLRDCLFVIDVPVPEASKIGHIRELAKQKLERLQKIDLPEPQLTGCWWPSLCSFVDICHSGKWSEPSEKAGFIPVRQLSRAAVRP